MLKELRPYQEEDALFLSKLPAGGCFNEQRTGKTPIFLKVCEICKFKRVVIVVPASAIYQWAEEIENWYGGIFLQSIPCVGNFVRRCKLIDEWATTGGILIISYGCLKTTSKKEGLAERILKTAPDAIAVDEAHRLRHKGTAQAKAVYKLSKIPRRYALTGTPAPGKSHDIWGILHFLFPHTFRGYWDFISEFYRTIRQQNRDGHTYIDILDVRPEKKARLNSILKQMSTQRKRKDVMPWLPTKDYQPVKLPLTAEQKKYLKELKEFWETEHITTIGVLDRLIRYRQICLAPELLNLKGSSPKLDWIDDYLSDYPERSTLIFSKFTSFLRLIKNRHQEVGVIVGDTPIKEREELRLKFQRGDLKVLLLQIDAGKEALTLDTAECIIFTDKYPPSGDIEQAEDRFVATTPERANKPHLIIELMMKGSYDEQLYKLVKEQASETSIINNYKSYMERSE
jgi:SNF2 family DNA or RNA helicase